MFDLYNPLFQAFGHMTICKKSPQVCAGLLPAHFFHPETITVVVDDNHHPFADILAFDGFEFGTRGQVSAQVSTAFFVFTTILSSTHPNS
ncbi:MAG: hypothetical protein CL930_13205 [Deltaproteobacteria bacterium]|nr:hypothetical protein [Deltaproteobacteria bacterium]